MLEGLFTTVHGAPGKAASNPGLLIAAVAHAGRLDVD
jgi:hypothetical protein